MMSYHDTSSKGLPEHRRIRPGDIVVTAVATHFVIGRVKEDGETQELLAVEQTCDGAVDTACIIAEDLNRVFLFWNAYRNDYRLITVLRKATWGGVTHTPAA